MLANARKKIQGKSLAGLSISLYRKIFSPTCKSFKLCKDLISDKVGLEIGGPSPVFSRGGLFPAYTVVKELDNCNFGYSTTWEGTIHEGETFLFDVSKPRGKQYVSEACALTEIPTGAYNFVLSSHMIEHTANPILAVSEWLRVLDETGTLVIIFPHKDGTFDRYRPVTSLEHLKEDFAAGMGEDDLTHLPEILELHDLSRDPESGGYEAFENRAKDNFRNRCLHQHVFDTQSAVGLIEQFELQIVSIEVLHPFHIVIVASKKV